MRSLSNSTAGPPPRKPLKGHLPTPRITPHRDRCGISSKLAAYCSWMQYRCSRDSESHSQHTPPRDSRHRRRSCLVSGHMFAPYLVQPQDVERVESSRHPTQRRCRRSLLKSGARISRGMPYGHTLHATVHGTRRALRWWSWPATTTCRTFGEADMTLGSLCGAPRSNLEIDRAARKLIGNKSLACSCRTMGST